MSRHLAWLLIAASSVAAGWSVAELLRVMNRTPAQSPAVAVAPVPETPTQSTDPARVATRTDGLDWPPVFGVPDPPLPAVSRGAAEPDVEDPVEGYSLKGLAATGSGDWAFLSGPQAEVLVRPGDRLPNGAVVVDIGEDGVSVRMGNRRGIIRFAEAAPVEIVRIPVRPDASRAPEDTVIRVQDVSPEDLRDMIVRANQRHQGNRLPSQGRPLSR